MISREEELQMMKDFIEKKGVTKLPPDDRLRVQSAEYWKDKNKEKRKRKEK